MGGDVSGGGLQRGVFHTRSADARYYRSRHDPEDVPNRPRRENGPCRRAAGPRHGWKRGKMCCMRLATRISPTRRKISVL